MIRLFITLTLQMFRNRVVHRLRRLRDPRYLAGAVAGMAYLFFMVFRNSSHLRARALSNLPINALAIDIVSIAVLVLMVLAWALPGDSGGLQFSEAEIAFLFPAPLRRRDLLLYKVIRSQPQVIASTIAFMIFGWRRSLFVGLWLAISALGVYFTLVALARARLRLMHIGFLARALVVSVILTVLASFIVGRVGATFGKVASYDQFVVAQQQLGSPFQEPFIRAVLFVPGIFASAVLPPDLPTLVRSAAGLVGLGVIFFLLAARLNVSFEEASIASAARRLQWRQRVTDRRAGRRVTLRRAPPLFRLAPTGPPEVAIVWKNCIALVRTSIVWVVILLAFPAALMAWAAWVHERPVYITTGLTFVMLAACFPLVSPRIFANDLRLDLMRAEILKSYPITGERLVRAEIAAPLVVIAAFEMLFATAASVLLRFAQTIRGAAFQFIATPQFVVTVLILALPVCAVQLLIRNAVPLYFPAWSLRGTDEPRGFVAAGQRFIILFGNLLVLVIVLLPAVVVFLPSIFVAERFFAGNPAFVAIATVPAAALVAGEAWLGVKMLGARFEQIDVSNEFDILAV